MNSWLEDRKTGNIVAGLQPIDRQPWEMDSVGFIYQGKPPTYEISFEAEEIDIVLAWPGGNYVRVPVDAKELRPGDKVTVTKLTARVIFDDER